MATNRHGPRPWAAAPVALALLLVSRPCALASDAPSPPAARPAAAELTRPGASVLMVTNEAALTCQDAARFGDVNGAGVDQCTLALQSSGLSQRDLAALHTNRGAIRLQHRQWAEAKDDFDAALKADPDVADAYVDRGAALLGLHKYAEAIADIDRGLALGPDLPEKAYFNRAIADEHLDDMKAAYQDYLKASQLAPNWDAPKAELARFVVQ